MSSDVAELVTELKNEAAEIRSKESWRQSDWDLATACTLESVATRLAQALARLT